VTCEHPPTPPHRIPDDGRLRVRALLVVLLAVPLTACGGHLPASGLRDGRPPQFTYVVSDGWHSTLVLERAHVLSALEPAFAGSRYVEVGWGDRAAYTAPRLTSQLGLRAAFRSTSSALHVAGFSEPVVERFAGLDVVILALDQAALDKLSQYIAQSFARDGTGHAIRLGSGYSTESGFYSATGRYHLLNTCNTWVARALRAAGRPIMPSLAHTASQLMGQVRTLGVLLQSRAP
jgi:uncharacterized protein (TIGR02117 family)